MRNQRVETWVVKIRNRVQCFSFLDEGVFLLFSLFVLVYVDPVKNYS